MREGADEWFILGLVLLGGSDRIGLHLGVADRIGLEYV
jgi:hypothetical protein